MSFMLGCVFQPRCVHNTAPRMADGATSVLLLTPAQNLANLGCPYRCAIPDLVTGTYTEVVGGETRLFNVSYAFQESAVDTTCSGPAVLSSECLPLPAWYSGSGTGVPARSDRKERPWHELHGTAIAVSCCAVID